MHCIYTYVYIYICTYMYISISITQNRYRRLHFCEMTAITKPLHSVSSFRSSSIEWSPHSLDLTILDFFWGIVKNKVNDKNAKTVSKLKDYIHDASIKIGEDWNFLLTIVMTFHKMLNNKSVNKFHSRSTNVLRSNKAEIRGTFSFQL